MRETALMRALPSESFDTREQSTPRVDCKALVTIRQNRYSVPVVLVGRKVLVKIGAREVEIFHEHRMLARTELVVLDELGYLALPEGAAELVFQVISERNERGSLIVTTNLPFGEWTKVFPDARLAKAVVDRITHRAHIIETGSESWRFRHGLQRQRKTPK